MDSNATHITYGFGTVIEEEYDLLNSIRELLAAEKGNFPQDIVRILERHGEQLAAIIARLEQRLLPSGHADIPSHGMTLPVHALADVPDIAKRPLANLLRRHRNLRRSIKTLIVQSGRRYEDEAGLWEAMQTHEKMEWMLAALINEGAMPRRGSAGGTDKAEAVWENEGGQGGQA
ncbi:hypothetical protein OH491_05780 [Termitidicoccus mucosus]|uniref:Ferritin/DPS protein domain-containing protein n=1 Tax=Termitidicoccus mucosus TaxID=1184151 RepID=A0A178IGT1_9BACT|nr:hypothetical protein AW736_19200 [Opitutaceae bacterium TSB47]